MLLSACSSWASSSASSSRLLSWKSSNSLRSSFNLGRGGRGGGREREEGRDTGLKYVYTSWFVNGLASGGVLLL